MLSSPALRRVGWAVARTCATRAAGAPAAQAAPAPQQVRELYKACLRSAERCPEFQRRQEMLFYVRGKFREAAHLQDPAVVRRLYNDGVEQWESMETYHQAREAKEAQEAARQRAAAGSEKKRDDMPQVLTLDDAMARARENAAMRNESDGGGDEIRRGARATATEAAERIDSDDDGDDRLLMAEVKIAELELENAKLRMELRAKEKDIVRLRGDGR